jgi:hypothetical protein
MLGGGQGKWALCQFCPTPEESLTNSFTNYKFQIYKFFQTILVFEIFENTISCHPGGSTFLHGPYKSLWIEYQA